jgi:hypothetical protein
MTDNFGMSDGDLMWGDVANALVDFVCMAKHDADPIGDAPALALYCQLNAYCARGAEENHEWVRVPTTLLGEITTGRMEERPPDPARPRDRVVAQPR